jgi:hypothetical protein
MNKARRTALGKLATRLEDIKNEQSHIHEQMEAAKEERLKRTAEEKKAKRKSFNEQLKMYLERRERLDKQDYEKRRITYLGGGFEQYEEVIKVTPFRVLVKEVKQFEFDRGYINKDDNNNHALQVNLGLLGQCLDENDGDYDKLYSVAHAIYHAPLITQIENSDPVKEELINNFRNDVYEC